MDEEDIREVELSTITAIYPDELTVDDNDHYTFTIELPVSLCKPLVVNFPAPSEARPAVPEHGVPADNAVESQELSNLPRLQLRVSLPEGYPSVKPPAVSISTSPPWLPAAMIDSLESDVERLWEELGHDQVVFSYVDHIQQLADNVFGLAEGSGTLEVKPEHKIAILDYDISAKREAFNKGTFVCGICLDPKKGLACHRLLDCGHVFCLQCLQDFYNNAITEGDVASVRCLEPNCAENRDKAAQQASGGKRRNPKTFIIPSELLQMGLDADMVKRYVTLKHKSDLDSDKNTIYCPRTWCQGAARSKKHKKPEGLEYIEVSEDESDEGNAEDNKGKQVFSNLDLLAICEDCSFAFCSRCGQSWHGEFKMCLPKERKDAITEEEKASLDYLKMHTTPCPTCAAPCQKTHGCNHMRCFRCKTHFCYLCSAWLSPDNPYQHFNIQPDGTRNQCFMRLWELEGGDGDDVGIAYIGGDGLRNANVEPGQYGQHLEIAQQQQENENDEVGGDDESEDADAEEAPADGPQQALQPAEPAQAQAVAGRVAVAREGILILRIEGDAAPVRDRDEARRQPAPAAARGRAEAVNNAHGRQAQARGRGHEQAHAWGQGRGRGQAQARAAVVGANRQNNRNQVRANRNLDNEDPHREGEGGLNQIDEEWVRHFVQLALNDQEDQVFEWDSGEEDD